MKAQKLFIKIIFGIVLAILVTSFFNVGISLFYPEPEYKDYCDEPRILFPAIDESEEVREIYEEKLEIERTCSKDYERANAQHDRVVFFILAPIGLILLIIGTFVSNLVIQITLMGSGFLNVVISIFENIEDKLPVFITIGILIVIGMLFTLRKLKD